MFLSLQDLFYCGQSRFFPAPKINLQVTKDYPHVQHTIQALNCNSNIQIQIKTSKKC